jgi:cytochrome P450
MAAIPRERSLDSSLALLREGSPFISRRCQRLASDIFRTRLLGRPALCALGAEAAEMFVTPDRFTRKGALPPTTLRVLQDLGSVHQLDGDAHHQRRQMFLSLLRPAESQRLAALLTTHWAARISAWETDAAGLQWLGQAAARRTPGSDAGAGLGTDEARRPGTEGRHAVRVLLAREADATAGAVFGFASCDNALAQQARRGGTGA